MALAETRLIGYSNLVTWLAVEIILSVVLLSPTSKKKHSFLGQFSQTKVVPGFTASVAEVTDGRIWYSISINSAASLAISRLSATMKATSSPTSLTRSFASPSLGPVCMGEPSFL